MAQAGLIEICAGQVRTREVCAGQACVAQVRAGELGLTQVSHHKADTTRAYRPKVSVAPINAGTLREN